MGLVLLMQLYFQVYESFQKTHHIFIGVDIYMSEIFSLVNTLVENIFYQHGCVHKVYFYSSRLLESYYNLAHYFYKKTHEL
jgi:hypothetical protein